MAFARPFVVVVFNFFFNVLFLTFHKKTNFSLSFVFHRLKTTIFYSCQSLTGALKEKLCILWGK